MRLGHDFGTVPFGTHQIAARCCCCEPAFLEHDISDILCPKHGLEAFLQEVLAP